MQIVKTSLQIQSGISLRKIEVLLNLFWDLNVLTGTNIYTLKFKKEKKRKDKKQRTESPITIKKLVDVKNKYWKTND